MTGDEWAPPHRHTDAEVRERAELISRAEAAEERLSQAEATLRAVEALHYRCGPTGPGSAAAHASGYCHECVVDWPCPTRAALSGEGS